MKKRTGVLGEELAVRNLENSGFTIVERNWRCEGGELDIVAKDGETLVFVEVKTRRTQFLGTPQEAVDGKKQARLRNLALRYIHKTGSGAASYRFDVVAVYLDEKRIEHIRDAF